MEDVFKVRSTRMVYSAEQQAQNAVAWITKMQITQVKKQTEFLGSEKTGYSVLGIGCKVLGLQTFPDVTSSKDFADAVGLQTEYGAFNKAQKYKNVYHKSLYHMGKEYSFGRLSNFLRKANSIRAIFVPEVAELLLGIYGKKGRKPKIK